MVEQNQFDPKDRLARARAVAIKGAGKTRPTVTVRDKRHGHTYELAAVDFDSSIHEKVTAAPVPAAETPPEDPDASGAGEGGGEASAVNAPVLADDHDELNAGKVIELIGNLEDAEAVAAVKAYEEANKKRKTVIHAAEARIAELEGTEDSG